MTPIGNLLHRNRFGQIVFNCPACGIECNFDAPSTMSLWYCSICTFSVIIQESRFLRSWQITTEIGISVKIKTTVTVIGEFNYSVDLEDYRQYILDLCVYLIGEEIITMKVEEIK